jgi:hypothetical protein
VSLWKGPLKWVGNLAFAGTIFGALFHYLRYGPKPEEKGAEDV